MINKRLSLILVIISLTSLVASSASVFDLGYWSTAVFTERTADNSYRACYMVATDGEMITAMTAVLVFKGDALKLELANVSPLSATLSKIHLNNLPEFEVSSNLVMLYEDETATLKVIGVINNSFPIKRERSLPVVMGYVESQLRSLEERSSR